MPRLVTANCPRCGAALELAPGLEVVTCRYCGFKSMIEWASRRQPATAYPSPIAPLDPNLGRIVAQVPQAIGKMVLWITVATTVLPMVLGGVIWAVAAGATSSARRVSLPSIAVPGATSPATATGPRMVDGAELIRKAHALAVAETPDPKLSSAVFFNVVGGLVDTTTSNAGSVDFDYRTTDPNAPPGKDVADVRLLVHVGNGTMTTMKVSWSAANLDRILQVPTCSSQSAWNAAVQSGVPANAVSTIHVYYNGAFSPKSPTVWSIRVDGHDEYRREIDARTCAMVKNGAAPTGSIKKR